MDFIRNNHIFLKKIGIIAGVYLGMKYLVPLVVPFLFAALIVCWCQPLLRWVKRRLHMKPAFVMAVLIVFVLLMVTALGCRLGKELGRLALRLFQGAEYKGQMERFLYDCCDSVGELLHVEASGLRVFVTEQLNVFLDEARQTVLPGAFDGSWQLFKGAGAVGAGVVVSVIAMLLLASDFEKIKETARQWPVYERAAGTIKGILGSVGGYLKAQAMIMGIVMLIAVAGIWISGSAGNPILAGIGTGFLDALPVFGTGTVFLPWILIRVLQKEYASALILAGTYAVCALTREFLEPKLIGSRLGILPVVILMSVYAGVKLYGLGGILLGPLSVLLVQELWGRLPAE